MRSRVRLNRTCGFNTVNQAGRLGRSRAGDRSCHRCAAPGIPPASIWISKAPGRLEIESEFASLIGSFQFRGEAVIEKFPMALAGSLRLTPSSIARWPLDAREGDDRGFDIGCCERVR